MTLKNNSFPELQGDESPVELADHFTGNALNQLLFKLEHMRHGDAREQIDLILDMKSIVEKLDDGLRLAVDKIYS